MFSSLNADVVGPLIVVMMVSSLMQHVARVTFLQTVIIDKNERLCFTRRHQHFYLRVAGCDVPVILLSSVATLLYCIIQYSSRENTQLEMSCCHVCHLTEKELGRRLHCCSVCQSRSYCSKECQVYISYVW